MSQQPQSHGGGSGCSGRVGRGPEREAAWRARHKWAAQRLAPLLGDLHEKPPLGGVAAAQSLLSFATARGGGPQSLAGVPESLWPSSLIAGADEAPHLPLDSRSCCAQLHLHGEATSVHNAREPELKHAHSRIPQASAAVRMASTSGDRSPSRSGARRRNWISRSPPSHSTQPARPSSRCHQVTRHGCLPIGACRRHAHSLHGRKPAPCKCHVSGCLCCQVHCRRRRPGSAPLLRPQQQPIEQRLQQAVPGAASSGQGTTVQQVSSRQQVCHIFKSINTSVQALGSSCCPVAVLECS